ncbi:MAG: Holliday junction branch migration protein RuvA [Bacteroidetes bacterium HGW-Bacteroidetes-6]|jgi:Holliday junction DNA helicase RuvA|nr:MAG: Holliday junction branch migration protein RuvA [Bacteroidetes bacterium HGW-Bacteroidetes-6]
MIHYLNGKITEINPTYAVVECSGVGYFVSISLNTYEKIQKQEQVKLLTHYIVREDGHFLFGFASEDERFIFRLLLGVSGVGANTARMLLSAMSPGEVVEAITTGNTGRLQKVKGIGLKTAERVIVDLRDKIDKGSVVSGNVSPLHNTIKQETLSALTQLGFARQTAEKAIDKVIQQSGDIETVEDMIRQALKFL